MTPSPHVLYLDLLKRTLSFTLWPEPPVPISALHYENAPVRKRLFYLASRILAKRQVQLVRTRDFSEHERVHGYIRPYYADTMIGLRRLDNLQYCIETVLQEDIKGDVIETGVWKGGACIFMRAVLLAYGVEDRTVFVADSFEGLPPPDTDKYPSDEGSKYYLQPDLAISQEEVENNFRRYNLLDEQVVFVKGWFEESLPRAPIETLSILRLDGDMYGSTIDALDNLYPKLSEGGFCIVDDYALAGCKAAVDDYRSKHGIWAEMKTIDWSGTYWRKGQNT